MEEGSGKSKYNISLLILQQVNQMIYRASNYYRAGEIDKWFYEWKNIKFQIIAELKTPERNSLKEKEKDITNLLKLKANWKEACGLIEDYLTEIQDYIKIKEIGLAEKKDQTVFT